MRRPLTLVALLAAFIAAAAAVHWLVAPQLEPRRLIVLLRELGTARWALPAFVGIYLCGTTLLLPAMLFHIVAGATWGFGPALVLNLALANLVSNLQFLAGRWLGRERVLAWLARRGWTGVERELEHSGTVTMMVLRQLPLPFVGVNVAAGASPLSWRQFLLGSGAGLVPPTVVYTYFAAAIAEGVEGAEAAAFWRALAAAAGIIALGVLSRWLMRSRAR